MLSKPAKNPGSVQHQRKVLGRRAPVLAKTSREEYLVPANSSREDCPARERSSRDFSVLRVLVF